MAKETKRCPECNIRRPRKDFPTLRHRICVHCVVARNKMALLYSKPAHAMGVPDIDKSTSDYTNWVARMRYRANKMKQLPPPLFLPKTKLCRRCSQSKPLSEFDTYRMRICKVCDGLPIR